jgi:hypothetical protein
MNRKHSIKIATGTALALAVSVVLVASVGADESRFVTGLETTGGDGVDAAPGEAQPELDPSRIEADEVIETPFGHRSDSLRTLIEPLLPTGAVLRTAFDLDEPLDDRYSSAHAVYTLDDGGVLAIALQALPSDAQPPLAAMATGDVSRVSAWDANTEALITGREGYPIVYVISGEMLLSVRFELGPVDVEERGRIRTHEETEALARRLFDALTDSS